jgi:hypothetical protein
MDPNSERDRNQAAFRRMENSIRENYPAGWFVGIAGGQIVSDAESVTALLDDLKAKGYHPPDVLAVQAGVEYPEYLIILLHE